ncbi:ABC transporter permease [Arthrospiribacter ruber]|uniref:ABC transporter permease n=1 Tax=Arthrospiribacter ruber TaxID=2487934 RepID=A0A951MD83_9BACT|nr:ABC transporter permease [Arthrospiribacter ruber]MBW3467031.1 ABC transporter permease [Arthrospiribacter ruber]
MLKNFLKTAFRSLARNRLYATLNLVGLLLGMAVILMVFLIYSYETSFDTFHSDADRIYRVNTRADFNGFKMDNRGAPRPLYELLESELPEIESLGLYLTNTMRNWKAIRGGEKFTIENPLPAAVNKGFFNIFDYNWIEGNSQSIFSIPNGVAISRSLSEKLFNGQVIGAEISAVYHDYEAKEDKSFDFQVAAIFDDSRPNTDFKSDIFIPYEAYQDYLGIQNVWGSLSSNFQLYPKLGDQVDRAMGIEKIENFINKQFQESENTFIHNWRCELMPLQDIHFDGIFGHDNPRKATKENLSILLLVGFIVLISASINFINLSTAFSFSRAKEVGIRKVIGSPRIWLVGQFLAETFLLVITAGMLSLFMIELVLPQLGPIYELGISGSLVRFFLSRPEFYLFFFGFVVILTLLSGIYPAMVLSGFNPNQALRTKPGSNKSSLVIRRSLVIVQITLSMVLIFGTLLVNRQLEFLNTQDLGFNHEHTGYFFLPSGPESQEKAATLKERVKLLPYVLEASTAGSPIISTGWSKSTAEFEKDGEKSEAFFDTKSVDPEYFSAYGMRFLAGKAFEPEQNEVMVVNESLAREIGANNPEDAVGRELTMNEKTWRISGVVADFHFQPLNNEIRSIMFPKQDFGNLFSYRFNQGDFQANTLEVVGMAKELFEVNEFKTYTVSEVVGGFYGEEKKLIKVLGLFTFLAYFICALGMVGLVSYLAFQKRKEISIRRVFGAGIVQVTAGLMKEFVLLVFGAAVLAIPLALVFGQKWLANFPYRTGIGIGIILGVVLISVLFTGFTVFFQSHYAASRNPADNLRSE